MDRVVFDRRFDAVADRESPGISRSGAAGEPVPAVGVHVFFSPSGATPRGAEKLGAACERLGGDLRSIQDDLGFAERKYGVVKDRSERAVEVAAVGSGRIGEPRERRGDARIERFLESRQKLVSNSRPRSRYVGVRRVVAVGLADRGEVAAEFIAS